MMGENESVMTIFYIHYVTPKNKHNDIAYHRVR